MKWAASSVRAGSSRCPPASAPESPRANLLPRNPLEAQQFDGYLQRALEIHLELEPADGAMQQHHATHRQRRHYWTVTAMDKEIATLQKLLDALNDSSILYRRLASGTASSHLRLLLGRAIRVHRWIAGELAERMRVAGGTPRHRGSLLGPLQALRAHWLARISPDVELAYVSRAARREDDVLQCFDDAVGAVTDIALRNHLQMHLRQIGHACTQIEHLGPPLPAPSYTRPTQQSTRTAVVSPDGESACRRAGGASSSSLFQRHMSLEEAP